MSRCFPYPPPGYALNRASKDALIESIKFQNERVKSKEQKKEKKEAKKEKRKEKKDKKSQIPGNPHPHVVQKQFTDNSWAETKSDFLFKGNKAVPEQLEQSGLTEEHSKPMCVRAPSTSSDSTENSNKRKRHSSPLDLTSVQAGKKIIRLKLPLKKQKTTDAPATEQQPCSTSGRSNVIIQNKDTICSRNVREQICSTSHPTEAFVVPKPPKKPTNKVLTPMERAELQYQSLMDNLVPLRPLDDDDNLDWLFKGTNRESSAEKKLTTPCNISWGLWPKAQYLKEVDVYALPYSVPF
ncbi:hypothetical protein CASFOL_016950 [Castilleja foliolosa]|uniref:Uncharacterized protein n=1 Tax=Castilleja foliolosa TaxID=1961234 RepID=A0ABD3D9P1_9LAMI